MMNTVEETHDETTLTDPLFGQYLPKKWRVHIGGIIGVVCFLLYLIAISVNELSVLQGQFVPGVTSTKYCQWNRYKYCCDDSKASILGENCFSVEGFSEPQGCYFYQYINNEQKITCNVSLVFMVFGIILIFMGILGIYFTFAYALREYVKYIFICSGLCSFIALFVFIAGSNEQNGCLNVDNNLYFQTAKIGSSAVLQIIIGILMFIAALFVHLFVGLTDGYSIL
mmetsp:Transcript_96369/g.118111  ORF Transcript_96369/g.118111 Transcript_96369/m.118111 type:complete len:226 (+) Transcript_96369:138-815(+)